MRRYGFSAFHTRLKEKSQFRGDKNILGRPGPQDAPTSISAHIPPSDVLAQVGLLIFARSSVYKPNASAPKALRETFGVGAQRFQGDIPPLDVLHVLGA